MSNPLKLPWTVDQRDHWVIRDADSGLIARAWRREDAEAIVSAMNATYVRETVDYITKLTEHAKPPGFTIERRCGDGWEAVAFGKTADLAWSRVPEGSGQVRMRAR